MVAMIDRKKRVDKINKDTQEWYDKVENKILMIKAENI